MLYINCHARSRARAPERGPCSSMGDVWRPEPCQTLVPPPEWAKGRDGPKGWSAVPWVGSGSVLPLGRLLHGPEMPQSSLLD